MLEFLFWAVVVFVLLIIALYVFFGALFVAARLLQPLISPIINLCCQMFDELNVKREQAFARRHYGISRNDFVINSIASRHARKELRRSLLDAEIEKIRTSPTKVKWWNLEKGLYWKIIKRDIFESKRWMETPLLPLLGIVSMYSAIGASQYDLQNVLLNVVRTIAVWILAQFGPWLLVRLIDALNGGPLRYIRRQSPIPVVASRQS